MMKGCAVADQSEQGYWRRDERVFVYLSQQRARYASITRAPSGRQMILFTHQTEDQEKAGKGDLWLVRRTTDGDWWFYPETIYEGEVGEPRTYGSMTTLESGKIIAPFAELNHETNTSQVRILSSEDDGQSWQTGPVIDTPPLVWASPYGRPFEHQGELVMPVFGAMTVQDLTQTRLCSGLLRSSDGGKTWGDWSAIAGPDSQSQVSFEFPAVSPLHDGTILAVTTQRQLKKRPELALDLPQALVRSYSSDGGRTWTEPEHMCVGAWASLTRMDDQTIACAFAIWAGWATMEAIFSQDGFRTVRHRLPFVEHNWLPGYGATHGWGTGWAREPIPLPPVVPHLDGHWNAGHFGFTSGLALDQEHLMLVFGQRQQGSGYTETAHDVKIPIEKERIESVTVKRVPFAPGQPAGPKKPHGEPKGKWRIAERWTADEWRKRTGQPGDEAMDLSSGSEAQGVSHLHSSGRWLSLKTNPSGEDLVIRDSRAKRIIGHERGYNVWKSIEDLHYKTELDCAYSDDEGETWHKSKIEQPVPLGAATHPMGSQFEEADGTVVATVYGYLNQADMGVSLYVSALMRSTDRGESWGDWSIIGYDGEARYSAYSETVVLPFSEDVWLAFLRTENRSYVPHMRGIVSRTVSTDRGRTWSKPEPSAAAGLLATMRLPDGAIAVAAQNTCGWGLTISYDYGRSWSYALPATYFPTKGGVLDDKTFWLYDDHAQMASVYRRE